MPTLNKREKPRRNPEPQRRKSKTPQKKQHESGILKFLRDRRTHIALGVILVVIAFVMAISTVSHLKNGALDQSLVADGLSPEAISNSGAIVHNTGGAFGAWLAHVLMTEGLGIGAFVLVIYLAVLCLSLLGVMRCKFWSLTFKCLFTAISLSVIAGLVTLHTDSFTHWGGVHGRQVNLWLEQIGSWPLTWAVTAVLCGLLVALFLHPIKYIANRLAALIPTRKNSDDDDAAENARDVISLDEISDRGENTHVVPPTEVNFEDDQEHHFSPTPATVFSIDNDDDVSLEDISDEPVDNNSYKLNNEINEKPQNPISSTTTSAVFPTDTTAGPTFTIKATESLDTQSESGAAPVINREPDEQLPYDPRADLSRYVFPTVDLLADRPSGELIDPEEQQKNKDLIVKTLLDYKIPIQRIEATIGPTVTLYEIVPAEGVRIAQIQRLENDIALSLAALGIRIIAPIPGAGTVGIEVPNRDPKTVSIRSIIGSKKFADACGKMRLPMAMGATISNEIFIQDLAKMPHLLVAGATGQGKSVGLNCIIASLLYAKHPSELKFVFIDPKMVEFAAYRKLERHYLAKLPDAEEPIITDANKVPATLASLCLEMDNRYELMSKAGVRSVEEYNSKFCRHALNPENGHKYMPYIVTIVDEFADLIMVGGKDVPMYIARIAQKGRASGMHIIIATQRPSADVISGMIKNNFPGRIAFRVMSMVDSKTILDRPGANQLIGRGDMLFLINGRIERVQCAFIDTPEIDAITDHIDAQIGYESAYLLPEAPTENAGGIDGGGDPSKRDALFNDCARFIVTQSTASTSSLQRRFSIGYNKAGKIMDQMEAAGIVGPAQGAKPRAVLMDAITLESIL